MATETRTDPTMILTEDHNKVRDLFKRFESAKGAEKQAVFAEIAMELEIHTKIEEEVFYPAVKRIPDLAEMVAEAVEEHDIVDFVLASMRKLSPDDERYDAKFKTLMENVEHHAEEEEKEMFPEASAKLPNANEIAARLVERKQELIEQMTKRDTGSRAGSGSRSDNRRKSTASKK